MSGFEYLVSNGRLPDISYRTDPPQEIVHPRVRHMPDGPQVYPDKQLVPLSRLIERLAGRSGGFNVAAYRSNGQQTTISFNKADRVTLSARLLKLLQDRGAEAAAAADAPVACIAALSEAVSPLLVAEPPTVVPAADGVRTVLPEELEARLERQRATGRLGEDAAYRHEYLRLLEQGCRDPAGCIVRASLIDVGAGYDLRSVYAGKTRYIEVKSSTVRDDGFFVSENERKTLASLGPQAYLYLVRVDAHDPRQSRVVREIRDPFGTCSTIALAPVAWEATLAASGGTASEPT